MDVRNGEKNKTWFRSERILHINDQWFFLTREQTQEGPFTSRTDAERELNYYIRQMNHFAVIRNP